MGLLMGQKLVKFGTSGIQTLQNTYLQKAGQIYFIQSSME